MLKDLKVPVTEPEVEEPALTCVTTCIKIDHISLCLLSYSITLIVQFRICLCSQKYLLGMCYFQFKRIKCRMGTDKKNEVT